MGKNKSKKGKMSNIALKIIFGIYLIASILLYIYIMNLNILSIKYLAILLAIMSLVTLIVAISFFCKKSNAFLKVLSCFIIGIFLVGYGYAYHYLDETFDFIDTMTSNASNQEVEEYYIIALKSSSFSTIEDINNEKLYDFNIKSDIESELLSNASITFEKKDSLSELSDGLLNGDINLLFVSSSQYGIILDEYEEFKDKTKIIYTLTHKVEDSKTESIKDEKSEHTIEQGSFNVYISGIDTSGNINNVSRSDANILVTVNTNTNEILLTSIPRDYYVTLHNAQAKDKLTHSGIYGINETITTVEDLLDIDINYYVRVNFTTVINLVDVLGGIDVDSDFDFSAQGYSFKKGINHLNGKQALAFSRERRSFVDGDLQRIKNQQKVINAIISKVLNSKTLLTQYSSILNSLSESFQTNIEQKDISLLVKNQLDNMKSWKVSTVSLSGSDGYEPTYSSGSQKLYVMFPDFDTVSNAKSKIEAVLNNK